MDLTFQILSVPVKENGGALQFGSPHVLIGSQSWSAPQGFLRLRLMGRESY